MDYRTEKYIKAKRLDSSYRTAMNCNAIKCPLFPTCSQMPSGGKLHNKARANIFLVFGSPQQTDVDAGIPAVSKEGVYFRDNWLDVFTSSTGGMSYLITHLVRAPLLTSVGSPRQATQTESAFCWEHFYRELMEHRPEVIIGFGDDIFNQLYNKAKNKETLPAPEDQSVNKLRLTPFILQMAEDYSPTVFIGHSPSYILKSPASGIFFNEERTRVINHICKREIVKKESIKIEDVKLIDTVSGALEVLDLLTRGLPKNEMFDLAFDTETDNLNRVYNNKFLSWQFTWEPNKAVFIPIEHPDMPLFADMRDKLKLIDAFQKLLNSSPEASRISWIIAHNAKFDLSVLYGLYRILPRGSIPIWDTLLGMHWLDENKKGRAAAAVDGKPYSLKSLAKEFFGFEYKSEQLSARAEGDLVSLSLDELKDYGGTDTIITWQIKQTQLQLADAQPDNALFKLERFMHYYYSPAARAVAFMECNGLHVSNEQLDYLQGEESPIWNRIERIENVDLQQSPEVLAFREEYKKIISGDSNVDYEEDLWGDDEDESAIPNFNPNKKDQETAFYLEHLGLRPLSFSKKTQKATLNKAFLNHYASRDAYLALDSIKPHVKYYNTPISQDEDGDPVFPKNPLQLILEYRELTKLGNTYLVSIGDMIGDRNGDSIDNRVRASYWLSGTDTGRLSSSNPNLQNLPSGRTPMAKEVKNLFQAEPPSKRFPQGTVLIQLDYKTAEVRWAAIFANDKNLIRLFNEARESLIKACSPDSVMTEEEFESTQLASDIHRRTASLMYDVDPTSVSKAQRQASKCLIGSTRLFTNKGVIPIESLVADTDDNNWLQRVSGVSVASAAGKTKIIGINHKWVDSTIRVNTQIGLTLQGDKDHPLVVMKNNEVTQKTLATIEVGDQLILPINNQLHSTKSAEVTNWNKDEFGFDTFVRVVVPKMTVEFARTLGSLAALHLNKDNDDDIATVVNILMELEITKYICSKDINPTRKLVRIPEIIFRSTRTQLEAFISAYLTVARKIVVADISIARDIQLLLLSLNQVSKLSHVDGKVLVEPIDSSFGDSMAVPVTEAIEVQGRVKVYDIEVEDPSHTFIANGLLSKNCITFGLIYGMGTQTLATNNGWTLPETEEKTARFFSAFPDLKRWLAGEQERAKKKGYVETKMGRRRRLDFLFATGGFKDEAKASRLAMNAPIQGQSSDGGTIGLFSFLQYLLENNLERRWIIENVVHDSCLVQVPMEDVEKALFAMQYYFVDGMAEYIKKYFNFTLPLPIECEIEVGIKYGALTKWDGRPSTLPALLSKLKEDASETWKKKEKSDKPTSDMDLIKWQGK